MHMIQVFPDVLLANQRSHGQELVICGSPEQGHNYMCSKDAQHQQETDLGFMWLATGKVLKRA
jgi:hypothetical protein